MIIRNIRKEKLKEVYFSISVLLIIYLTDTLLFATNNNELFRYIKRGLPVLITAVMVFIYIFMRRKVTKLDIHMTFIVMSIFVSMLLSGRYLSGFSYITQAVCLVFALQYSYKVSIEKFAEKYVQIMKIIAIVSLALFVLSSLGFKFNILPTIVNTAGRSFKTAFFTNIPVSTSLGRRNWGPFWEPGVFQCYLNIAIYFSLFYVKRNRATNVVIFSLAALSTLSGAVLIPMLLIFSAYVFEKRNTKAFGMIMGLIFLLILLFSTGLFDEIIYKLFHISSDSTIWYRLGSMLGGIKATISHPFFGAPPDTFDGIREEIIYSYTSNLGAGNTNTFITYFAHYGVFVGGYLLVRLWRFSAMNKRSIISGLMIFLAIFATTSNENLSASLLICVLLFLKNGNRNEEKTSLITSNINKSCNNEGRD